MTMTAAQLSTMVTAAIESRNEETITAAIAAIDSSELPIIPTAPQPPADRGDVDAAIAYATAYRGWETAKATNKELRGLRLKYRHQLTMVLVELTIDDAGIPVTGTNVNAITAFAMDHMVHEAVGPNPLVAAVEGIVTLISRIER